MTSTRVTSVQAGTSCLRGGLDTGESATLGCSPDFGRGFALRQLYCSLMLAAALGAALLASSRGGDPSGMRPGESVSVGGIELLVPPPGVGVAASESGPDSAHRLVVVKTAPDGTVSVDSADSSDLPTDSDLLSQGSSPAACDDPAFNLEHHMVNGSSDGHRLKWYDTYKWWFKSNTTPAEMTASGATEAFRDAVQANTSANDCGMADQVSATASYQGTNNNANINVTTSGCGSYNNVSSVGYGDLDPNGKLGRACYWFYTNVTPHEMFEGDVKLNKADHKWAKTATASDCSNKWSTQGVATHEFGHVFGVGHVSESDHANLTMSTKINGACQNSESTLGKGDIRALRELY